MDTAMHPAHQDVKIMLQDAMLAVQAASASAAEATARIEAQATDPDLKALLQQGSKHAQAWSQRLSQAAQNTGGHSATQGNPILEAIQQVGSKIVGKARDPAARDLGIIASGQLALHYYIAAFGTMAAYAKLLGMTEVAGSLHQCLEEAKASDERHTELAGKIGE